MEKFIDGDLAANNGGWQWTASVSILCIGNELR